MNPIDNNISKITGKVSIEEKFKTERLNIKKNLKLDSKDKNNQLGDVDLKQLRKNSGINYIHKQFLNYNDEISKTIYLKDTLQALSNRVKNSSNPVQVEKIVKKYINTAIFKGDKVLKNYESILKTSDKNTLTNTVSKLLSSTEYKLKRLNVVIQNLDSVLNYRFDNTTNILNEIVTSLSKTQNVNIENLIFNIQGERVIKLLKG